MNHYIEPILLLILIGYGIHVFLKKSWLFDVSCLNCSNTNTVKWTIKDGVKDNTRLYCFLCYECGKNVVIRDRSFVLGSLPVFEVVRKSEIHDEMAIVRSLPTVQKE